MSNQFQPVKTFDQICSEVDQAANNLIILRVLGSYVLRHRPHYSAVEVRFMFGHLNEQIRVLGRQHAQFAKIELGDVWPFFDQSKHETRMFPKMLLSKRSVKAE